MEPFWARIAFSSRPRKILHHRRWPMPQPGCGWSASTVLIFVNSLRVTTPTRMYRTPAHSNQRARLVVASDRGY